MATYYALAIIELVLLGLAGLLSRRQPEGRRGLNYFDYLAMLVLVAFAGLRYYTGSDYGRFLTIYEEVVTRFSWGGPLEFILSEPGYLLLNWVTKMAFPGQSYAIFWTAACLMYIPLYITLRRNSRIFFMAILGYILLGFYTTSFNIMKQSIAATFLFLSFLSSSEQRPLKSGLLFLGAVSFHLSSLVYLPILLFWRSLKPSYLMMGCCVTIGMVASVLITPILSRLPIFDIYLQYADAPGTQIGAWLISGAWIMICLTLLAVKSRLIDLDQRNRVHLSLLICSLIFAVGSIENILLARLMLPLQYGVLQLIPDGLKLMDKRLRGMMAVLIIGLMMIWFGLHTTSYNRVVPYQTYLSF